MGRTTSFELVMGSPAVADMTCETNAITVKATDFFIDELLGG